jgi:NTE family protein
MAIGKIITYHKVGESFIGDLYVGGSIESGNVWESHEKQFDMSKLRLAGSLFVGYDTIFGPLYIAFGHADGGYNAGGSNLGHGVTGMSTISLSSVGLRLLFLCLFGQ